MTTKADDIVICSPLRTPIGRHGGALRALRAEELGAQLLTALLCHTRLAGEHIDDVILGHSYPTSEAPAIGRIVALDAGLPVSVPGMQIDRRCGSGLQAVLTAASLVSSGGIRLAVAGGIESMSNVPHYTFDVRWGTSGSSTLHDGLARGRVTAGGKNHPVPGGMLETAENLRREFSITRSAQDELAAESHRRAIQAQATGIFAEEIVPLVVSGKRDDQVVSADEHPRPGTTVELLGGLRPMLGQLDPEATVTAGNASGQNDAAAMCIVTTRSTADELGLRPLVRLVSWGLAGLGPATMGLGPVPASAVALERASLDLADIDLLELNEAFAAQVLACTAALGLGQDDFERLNVHGSGISLGHPVGATGARILTTLSREMQRRGARYGLETMCIGGGQGLAAIFELTS